jgi:hypothetical protein
MNHDLAYDIAHEWLISRSEWDESAKELQIVIHDEFRQFKKKHKLLKLRENNELHVWWNRVQPWKLKGEEFNLD